MREGTKLFLAAFLALSSSLLQFLALDLKKENLEFLQVHRSRKPRMSEIYDNGAATWPMSTVKPWRELAPSEDVIDFKPGPDDLIDEELNFVQEKLFSQKKKNYSDTYIWFFLPFYWNLSTTCKSNADSGAHLNRLQFQQQQTSIHAAKQLDIQSSQVYETGRLCEPEVLNSLGETYSPSLRNNSKKVNIWKRKLSEENVACGKVSC